MHRRPGAASGAAAASAAEGRVAAVPARAPERERPLHLVRNRVISEVRYHPRAKIESR
jgi:hypothetical protein